MSIAIALMNGEYGVLRLAGDVRVGLDERSLAKIGHVLVRNIPLILNEMSEDTVTSVTLRRTDEPSYDPEVTVRSNSRRTGVVDFGGVDIFALNDQEFRVQDGLVFLAFTSLPFLLSYQEIFYSQLDDGKKGNWTNPRS